LKTQASPKRLFDFWSCEAGVLHRFRPSFRSCSSRLYSFLLRFSRAISKHDDKVRLRQFLLQSWFSRRSIGRSLSRPSVWVHQAIIDVVVSHSTFREAVLLRKRWFLVLLIGLFPSA
jgi:hypothetical protein